MRRAPNIDILQEESGFDAGKQPRALLYLLLRHALQVAFQVTGVREKARRGLIRPSLAHYARASLRACRRSGAAASESRYAVLHERLAGANIRIADLISRTHRCRSIPSWPSRSPRSTAWRGRRRRALERVFAEHIDCVSYRLDAWKQGVLHWQLESMRAADPGRGRDATSAPTAGSSTSRPRTRCSRRSSCPPRSTRGSTSPATRRSCATSTNLGLMHAPSLNQATTAAVLRNGYQANDGRLAVDLSSRRVRLALGILEGMRNGQSLGRAARLPVRAPPARFRLSAAARAGVRHPAAVPAGRQPDHDHQGRHASRSRRSPR